MDGIIFKTSKPTSVSHSVAGNLTSSSFRNLIVVLFTRLEIYLVISKQLQLVLEQPLCEGIMALQLYHPHGEPLDLLFLANYENICLLRWDADTSDLVISACVCLDDLAADRAVVPLPVDERVAMIDSHGVLIVLSLFKDSVEVIPLDDKGQPKTPLPLRLGLTEGSRVIDVKFIDDSSKTTFMILIKDNENAQHVRAYEYCRKNERCDEYERIHNLTKGAYLLLPVPQHLRGVLIVGKEEIVYREGSVTMKISIAFLINAYGRVDAKFLLSNASGSLYELDISTPKEMKLVLLGKFSIACSISCVDDTLVYIGSSSADSQLIEVVPKQHRSPKEKPRVLITHVNLGPVKDICRVERDEKNWIGICSARDDGSFHMMESSDGRWVYQGEVEFENVITGIWSLRSLDNAESELLVLSFLCGTRIVRLKNTTFKEIIMDGFLQKEETLFCCNVCSNQYVQVTKNAVRLLDKVGSKLQEWKPPNTESIIVATANDTKLLLALNSKQLIYFAISYDKLMQEVQKQLEYVVSCLHISENSMRSEIVAVGTWKASEREARIMIFSCPTLELMEEECLTEEGISEGGIPHSILVSLEKIPILLCGLKNGFLLKFMLNIETGRLMHRKVLPLGSVHVTLSANNTGNIFAVSSEVFVISGTNRPFKPTHEKDVHHLCLFYSTLLGDSIAFVKGEKLIIGKINHVKDLNILTVKLDVKATHVCYVPHMKIFVVGGPSIFQPKKPKKRKKSKMFETFSINLISDDDKPKVMSKVSKENLRINSMDWIYIEPKFYLVVGAVNVNSLQMEQKRSGLYLFQINTRDIKLVQRLDFNGLVQSVKVEGRNVIVATDKRINIYVPMAEHVIDQLCLVKTRKKIERNISRLRIYGNRVLGRCNERPILLSYVVNENKEYADIESLAHNFEGNPPSTIEFINSELYIGAEENNLLTFQKDDSTDGFVEVDKVCANKFVKTFGHSVVIKNVVNNVRFDAPEITRSPALIFGTADGAIGVVSSLPNEDFNFFQKLQLLMMEDEQIENKDRRLVMHGRGRENVGNILDGDFIEQFFFLEDTQMSKLSEKMGVSIDEVIKKVEQLKKLF